VNQIKISMKKLLLLIIPILLFIHIKINHIDNFWLNKYDPEYSYLLNGLNLTLLRGNIGHTDHPGTTVQEISAVIIRIAKLFSNSGNDLPTDVLSNPEYYLKFLAWTFSFINIFLILISAYIIYRFTNEIIYGILFESIPFLSPTLMVNAFFRVSPEPLLFTSVIILLMTCLLVFKYEKIKGYLNVSYIGIESYPLIKIELKVVLLSLIIGFSLATKLNSLPLVLFPFLLIPKFKNKLLFLIFIPLFFILFTLPIVRFYKGFIYWVYNLIFHSGMYGHGDNKIIDLHDFTNNLFLICKYEPFFIFILVLSIIIIIKWIINKKNDPSVRFLVGIVIVQIIGIFMIAKHFAPAYYHYLVPVIPTVFINLFIIISSIKITKIQRIYIISTLIVINFLFNFNYRHNNEPSYLIDSKDQKNVQNIYSYGCFTKIQALYFGNYYASYQYSDLLSKIYGEQYFYNYWTKIITNWKDSTIAIDTLKKTNKKLIINGNESYLKNNPPPFSISKIAESKFLVE
jgi:hypothetical protein